MKMAISSMANSVNPEPFTAANRTDSLVKALRDTWGRILTINY